MRTTLNRCWQPCVLAAAIAFINGDYGEGVTENQEDEGESPTIELVEVRAVQSSSDYSVPTMNTATKFGLSAFETPQSVSVITRAQIDDFELDNMNDVLSLTTGINVESVETDRTYYTARGFDITNFQYDGMGLQVPDGNISGDIDTYAFERVEVVRGPNGLMTGAGNPSATVNMVRKRPTDDLQIQTSASAGSYDHTRVESDISGRLGERVRGRFVTAWQDNESHLDRYAHEKSLVYGVVDVEITDATLLTLGYTWQRNKSDSPMWGALPLLYSDGSEVSVDRSTSTASDWAGWISKEAQAFAEVVHDLGNGWQVKGTYTYIKHNEDADLFYAFGTPDRETGLGLYGYGSDYTEHNTMDLFDVYISGQYRLAGREHDLVLGYSWSESVVDNFSYMDDDFPAMPDFRTWNGSGIDMNLRDIVRGGGDYKDRQRSIYGATRLSITDKLKVLLGARVSDWDTSGESYGLSQDSKYSGVTTPYAGVVYQVLDNVALYASYTDIFTQQTEEDINGSRLDPLEGRSYEVGVKSELLAGRLLLSVAAFDIEQENLAVSAGFNPMTGDEYYESSDGISSQGFEVELVGEITRGWDVMAGYTNFDMDANQQTDENIIRFTPDKTFKLASSYRLPWLPALKMGVSVKWQDETSRIDSGAEVTQDSYKLVDLFANYDLSDNLRLSLNVKNVTDEKYFTSLYWAQSYYGAPTTATASINWRY